MSPPARNFWRRYYLLTVLLPAYALAALYYGSAGLAVWGLAHRQAPPGLLVAVFIGAGVMLILALAATFFSATSYRLTGLTRQRLATDAGPATLARLTALQTGGSLPTLTPVLFELGAVPFLALGSGRDELWVSTYTFRTTDEAALRCLIAHEQAHAARPPRGCWDETSWLLAFPLCWLTASSPMFWPALAALHVSLWLRWQQAQTDRRETAADQRAAQAVGRDLYAKALVAQLAPFEELGKAVLLKRRLGGLGLSKAEIEQLLASRFEIV